MHDHTPAPGWALVTGASAGIGAAFARELARRGHALVLVARRRDRLEALARELGATHGVRTLVVALDLAREDAVAELHATTEAAGVAVEMLVNNAGYGVTGHLPAQPWVSHRDFIRVLMSAPVELCWRYVPAMQARGRGYVVNVASLAGLMPGSAGHTLYAASKSFLIKFSQSLALENAARGVHVTALCPGFTYSEFHDVTGARAIVSKMPDFMWMQADEVAADGVDAVLRGDVVRICGAVNRAIGFFGKHLPDGLGLLLMQRQSKRF
ncbi:MAG TPA: SDR family oxidoreductase, partial [Candidatus Saccharimonadia bacterium]|nr:SDR family oxidoreductase [Candidatus Saccharimonadia bacterium]